MKSMKLKSLTVDCRSLIYMYIYIYRLQEFNQRAIRVAFAELRLVLPLGVCYPL